MPQVNDAEDLLYSAPLCAVCALVHVSKVREASTEETICGTLTLCALKGIEAIVDGLCGAHSQVVAAVYKPAPRGVVQ